MELSLDRLTSSRVLIYLSHKFLLGALYFALGYFAYTFL